MLSCAWEGAGGGRGCTEGGGFWRFVLGFAGLTKVVFGHFGLIMIGLSMIDL